MYRLLSSGFFQLPMFSRFIHVVACISTLFLWLNNILLHGYTFCLSIDQLMDNWFFYLSAIVKCYEHLNTFLFEHLFSNLLGLYQGVELLDHIILIYTGVQILSNTIKK